MSQVDCEVRDGIAVVRMQNPPVNSLGLELRAGIVAALARAEDDPAVKAVVIIGSGKGFSGGADIREFGTRVTTASPARTPRSVCRR
jgi:3-hydroxyacyl-CoA dehydrogenase